MGQVPQAADASKLGGKDASVYLDGCDQGTVHGFARVASSGTFGATFTTTGVSPAYNCTGGIVQARRVAQGVYLPRSVSTAMALSWPSALPMPTAVEPMNSSRRGP